MPVNPTYPGVYIEEIPSGVRTIVGVATSITAFVGRAARGPVDRAVTINNFGDFERIFGGLWADSSLGFAVRDFYLNGGSQAVIVRLFNPTFASEAERSSAAAAAKTVADATTGSDIAAAKKGANDAAAAIQNNNAKTDIEKKAAKAVSDAVDAAHGAAGATVDDLKKAAKDAAALAAPITKAQLSANGLGLEAAYEGTWGNYLRARVDHDVSESVAKVFNLNKTDLFNITVRDTKTGATEQFRNLTVKDGPRRADKVLENESRLVRVIIPLPAAIPTAHGSPATGKDFFEDDTASTKVPDDKKAADGLFLVKDSFTGSGKAAAKKGLFALEQTDLFNLLCIPPYLNDGNIHKELIDEAIPYCEKRRAMLLIDPPTTWIDKDAATAKIGTDVGSPHKNAAIFFPRLRQSNPLRENQMEDFVPCGAAAGIFARTDTTRGVWKAPAGLDATLIGVPQLSVPLTDAENGELNPLGINCLRVMPPAGRIVWGSRTRVGDDRLASEWKYIPVRRTALFIEESLYRGTQWVVFEPNDEPLWAQIRLNVGAFMHNLFRQGAFQGRTPREAYLVKCDKETTTQNDINLGIVNIVVGFAPLKPAEFVIIKIQQLAGQIEV